MTYQLTNDATHDMIELYVYSLSEYGDARADHYQQVLESHFLTLVDNPLLGRDFSHIRQGVRRSLCQSHGIYYRATDAGILILRVLHQSSDPARFV